MKKILTTFLLLLGVVVLSSCGSKTTTNETKKVEENSSEAKKAEESSSQQQKTNNSSQESSNDKNNETQIVGSDEYGYVKVPKKWMKFNEVNGGNDIQYSDGTDINIVTLNTFTAKQLGITEAEYEALHPVQVSDSIMTKQKSNPIFKRVWGAKSKIGGYDAYVINCEAKTGKYLVIWIFKSNDGKIRYVSLEGIDTTFNDNMDLIEASWTNKK